MSQNKFQEPGNKEMKILILKPPKTVRFDHQFPNLKHRELVIRDISGPLRFLLDNERKKSTHILIQIGLFSELISSNVIKHVILGSFHYDKVSHRNIAKCINSFPQKTLLEVYYFYSL